MLNLENQIILNDNKRCVLKDSGMKISHSLGDLSFFHPFPNKYLKCEFCNGFDYDCKSYSARGKLNG